MSHGGYGAKVMTRRQTTDLCGFAGSGALYRLMASDPTFPRPIRPMGPHGHPRWLRDQVERWLTKKGREAQASAA
jgi:predicted DNA-binding transcriptional regulator AlpA